MNGLVALRHEQDAVRSAFVGVFLRDGTWRTAEANLTIAELAMLKMAIDSFAFRVDVGAQTPRPDGPEVA